jgi:hypothetical protein
LVFTAYATGQSPCEPCPIGHHSTPQCIVPITPSTNYTCDSGECLPSGIGKEPCAPCEPGSFSDETRSRTCKTCLAGYYCPLGSSKPMPCEYGCYCPESTGNAIPCPPGYICEESGLKEGVPCSPGHFCSGGSASAQECPKETYCDKDACVTCIACSPPFWQSDTASVNCNMSVLGITLIALSAVVVVIVAGIIWTISKRRSSYDPSNSTPLIPRAPGPKYQGL